MNVHVADSVSPVGMAMLAGHELRMEVIPDGPVEITPITKLAA